MSKVVAIGDDGEMYYDVAPDLSETLGSHRGNKKITSTNSIVQKSLVANNLRKGLGNSSVSRRYLQQELGINPSQGMLDFLKNKTPEETDMYVSVWKVIKRTMADTEISSALGIPQYEEVFRLKDLEYLKRCEKIERNIGQTEEHVSSLKVEVDKLRGMVYDATGSAQTEVAKGINDVKVTAEGKVNEFITSHSAKCEDLEGKLKDFLARATIGRLSRQFESKQNELVKAYRRSQKFFYGSLIAFAVFGCLSIWLAHSLVTPEFGKTYGILAFVLKMPRAIIQFAPFYLPLFWYSCHVNRLMNQNRRLMEEYAHKVVVSETYIGLAEQVEELEKKGVLQTKALSQDLLESTIRVLCTNPNTSLDKVKGQTPVSEVVDNVVKLVRTTTELKGEK
jgi:hypothetical protein